VLALDADGTPLRLDLGDGLGSCALSLPAAAVDVGVRGLRASLQKLPLLGLAELGDGRPGESRLGILSRPRAAAGSLTFSPNDSRTVRRVDRVDCVDLGEYSGGCSDDL
jgi:hypothetical protein